MHSLSTLPPDQREEFLRNKEQVSSLVKSGNMAEAARLQEMNKAAMGYFKDLSAMNGNDLLKSTRTSSAGVINQYEHQAPGLKGIIEPDGTIVRWGYDARGLREKYFNLSFDILREIAQRTIPIGAIQNNRCMQLRPFSQPSYNDNDVGFRVKLNSKEGIPDKQDKIVMAEIEEFLLNCGNIGIEGSDEREGLAEVLDMLTRETMTIDQIAISLRRNRKGKMVDFWVLDAATIKRVLKGREKTFGDERIKFVQEIDGRILETFTPDDLIFTYMNRRTHIRRRGYGYSYLEMCIDMITAWLFGMAYNKEIFNSSSQPKGILSFAGQQLEQEDLEELQRQWISMFRGVKGMWKTPILQHDAKWIQIAPNNRDMEFNEYIQMLSSWICAIHGIDAAELGMKLNQTGGVLNENKEAQLYYSKDRGLKDLLYFHGSWMNNLINRVPEWKRYHAEFTGMEAKSQKGLLEVDQMQVKTYLTVNEKRKEKDLPPLPDGDVILDPTYIQFVQAKQMEQQESQQEEGGSDFGDQEALPAPEEDEEGEEGTSLEPELGGETEDEGGEGKSLSPSLKKSKKDEFIEIII